MGICSCQCAAWCWKCHRHPCRPQIIIGTYLRQRCWKCHRQKWNNYGICSSLCATWSRKCHRQKQHNYGIIRSSEFRVAATRLCVQEHLGCDAWKAWTWNKYKYLYIYIYICMACQSLVFRCGGSFRFHVFVYVVKQCVPVRKIAPGGSNISKVTTLLLRFNCTDLVRSLNASWRL